MKSSFKREQAAEIYSSVRELVEIDRTGSEIPLRTDQFEKLVYPFRLAAKKNNLKLLKGRLLNGNNHLISEILFLPERIEYYPVGKGQVVSKWFNVIFLKAKRIEKTKYELEVLDQRNVVMNYELYSMCEAHGRSKVFDEFVMQYMEEVSLAGVEVGIAPELYRYVVRLSRDKMTIHYPFFLTGDREKLQEIEDRESLKEARDREYLKEAERRLPDTPSKLEALLFSATVFSICKRIYLVSDLKDIDVHFALHIPFERAVEGNDLFPFWGVNEAVNCWCNFRSVRGYNKKSPKLDTKFQPKISQKFRNNWGNQREIPSWSHLYLPVVYSDYKDIEWGDKEIERYKDVPEQLTRKELERISGSFNLSIILPVHRPSQPYPAKNCLTIINDINSRPPQLELRVGDIGRGSEWKHSRIIEFYKELMRSLDGRDLKGLKKMLRKSYKRALKEYTLPKARPTPDQQHKACLLGTMYFVDEALLGERNTYSNLHFYLRQLKRALGLRQATLNDFLEFILEALAPNSPYHKIVLQDSYEDKWIYLDYKNYWEEFEKYCKKRRIELTYPKLSFRRDVLFKEGYIRSQSNGGQRFNCRKVIDGHPVMTLAFNRQKLSKRQS